MNKVLLTFLMVLLLVSCNKPQNKNQIYFGGEILNPKSHYVLLMQNEAVVDSIKLNEDNTFEEYYDSLQPGLYFFKHGNEFQYIFFEPKDSIRIRLNTWDFDESLVFEGVGSEKNDFLLNVFLMNEKEMDNFYSYFPLSEKEFSEKFQEAFVRNNNILSQFLQSSPNTSKVFKHLAESAVAYPLYRFKELYPIYHQKLTEIDSVQSVSPSFYDFRKNVNFNDASLIEYYAYQNYISSYLYNEAFAKNEYKGIDENFKKILLNLIVEKISNKEMKDRLLYQEMLGCLFKTKEGIKPENLDLFYNNCSDSTFVSNIKSSIDLKEKMPNKSSFVDFVVMDDQQQETTIGKLIKGNPAVLYFWPNETSSIEAVSKRVNYLKTNYPSIKFIGIHQNSLNFTNSHLYFPQQFYLTENSKGRELISSEFPRTIIIDRYNKVINNFALISDVQIEKQLENISR